MLHYTDDTGYKSISSQVDWTFKAAQPPAEKPIGAYFTTLHPDAHRFSARTRIPKEKQEFVFDFEGQEGLKPIDGGRGVYIYWSSVDYVVVESRQTYHGPAKELP